MKVRIRYSDEVETALEMLHTALHDYEKQLGTEIEKYRISKGMPKSQVDYDMFMNDKGRQEILGEMVKVYQFSIAKSVEIINDRGE